MATITCDRCDKPFNIPSAVRGQKVPCPACGDINVVRESDPTPSTPQPREDRAAQAGYPPALGPEVDVITVHPAMLRAKPVRFILLVIVILAGLTASGYFVGPTTSNHASKPLAATCFGAAILAVLYLISWRIKTLGDSLRITTKRTIDQHGLFSKDTSDVLHADIKNIQIRQSFMDRLWGVGHIALSSSAEHEEEISIADIPNPEKIRFIIDLYRQL